MIIDKKLMQRARQDKYLVGEIFNVARHSSMEREEVRQLILSTDFIRYLEARPDILNVLENSKLKFWITNNAERTVVNYFNKREEARARVYSRRFVTAA